MSENFKTFISEYENSLREMIETKDILGFSLKIIELYPLSSKKFEKETDELLKKAGALKLFNKIQKNESTIVSDFKNYEILTDRIVIEDRNGDKKEHPLLSPLDLLKNGLGLTESDEGFFLAVSFFILPSNYETLQLFNLYLSTL